MIGGLIGIVVLVLIMIIGMFGMQKDKSTPPPKELFSADSNRKAPPSSYLEDILLTLSIVAFILCGGLAILGVVNGIRNGVTAPPYYLGALTWLVFPFLLLLWHNYVRKKRLGEHHIQKVKTKSSVSTNSHQKQKPITSNTIQTKKPSNESNRAVRLRELQKLYQDGVITYDQYTKATNKELGID